MKKTKKEKNTLSLVANNVMLSFILIISNVVVNQTFNIGNEAILFTVFIYPLVFFFANRINKEYGIIQTYASLFTAILVQCIMYYTLVRQVSPEIILASICAFSISQLVNTALYAKNIKNKKIDFIAVLPTYMLAIIIDSIIFSLIINGNFSMNLIYSICFKLIIVTILSAIEHKKYQK